MMRTAPLSLGCVAAAAIAFSASAQESLVAIGILVEPDATMGAAAEEWNARLREQTPQGFELDAPHAPRITLLQAFVAAQDMGAVLAAVGTAASEFDIGELQMEATGLYHIPTGATGLQGILIAPSPQLLALQASVIAAVEPFSREGGGEDAFVPDPTGRPFNPYVFEYVETFGQDRTGANFDPHVTTGVGPVAWLEERETEPFDTFTFGAEGIAVYQLGNFGTAAERLAEF